MILSELKGQNTVLRNLNNINIIIGRNGAGKSRFLREIEAVMTNDGSGCHIRYVSPERAGSFKRDGNVMTHMGNNPDWLRSTRSQNQVSNFKSASAMLFRDAETNYLRRLEESPSIRSDLERTFQNDRLSKINRLLTNISLQRSTSDYEFRSLEDDSVISPEHISSGESEAVSLSSEILYFFDTLHTEKMNVLLLDEPDVHLHPDLQSRLAKLIVSMLEEYAEKRDQIAVCIATHSTALISALVDSECVSIGTKNFGVDEIDLESTSVELQKVAPFFGHPLSLALNQDAPVIIEGEDDERVWQQAARSSQGKIKIFPVLAKTVNQQAELEQFCGKMLSTLYDDPLAFSIRDGDGVIDQPIEHKPPIRRYRLSCYAIENALLTDECLGVMGKTWSGCLIAAKKWIAGNADHQDIELMERLVNSSDRLRHEKIKSVRQLICAISECSKPWEVVVGQAIGALTKEELNGGNMLVDYLGQDLLTDVVFRGAERA